MSRFVFSTLVLLAALTACDRDPPKTASGKAAPIPATTPAQAPALPSIPADIAAASPRRNAPRKPGVASAPPGQDAQQQEPYRPGQIDDGRSPEYDGDWSPEDDAPAVAEPDFDRDDYATRPFGSHWGGVGAARFGMDFDEIEDSWQGGFRGEDSGECFYANEDGAGPALMFERGRFVRYDVDTPGLRAPGGGRVGMEYTEILEAYGQVERLPHKYTDGEYLRVESPDGNSVLLFETDPDGVITRWRMGVEPQVDYVEGCS